ncbi:ionotropic receptor 93a-like [Amblyomma americanum]
MKLGEYNWSGALGMLNTRDTDWVTFLDITEQRMGSFSMTDSLISHPVAILVQKPKILSRKMLFVQPFSTQVWALVLASIPVVSVALWLVYNWSPEEATRLRRGQGLSTLHNCVWYTYGALLQQGGVHLPVGTSSRLVVGTWWLYVVIVMAYYSSNLIAFLTVPEPQWLVSSFREAVLREDLHLYVPFGTGLHQEISKSSNEEFVMLRRRLKKRSASAVQDVHEVVDAVAAGKAILIADKILLDALVMADYRSQRYRRCRLAILRDNILRLLIGIGTRKGSPFVANLNHDFFELRSSGNLRFLLKNHREKPHACIRDYDAETRGLSKPIGLSELESAFLLLLLGTAASSLLVPVEFAARWARTRRRARKLRPPAGTARDHYAWSWPNDSKARPFISLRHGWKRADKAVWTTVGPGGHVLSDCYPAFGQFGRRPLFVQESPPFPFYQPCWGGTAVAQESEQHAGDRQQGHVVMVGNWP